MSNVWRLLRSEDEPSVSDYKDAAEYVLENPSCLSDMVKMDADQSLIFYVTTNYSRLTLLFNHLLKTQIGHASTPSSTRILSESMTTFLTYLTPSLSDSVDNNVVIGLMVPALRMSIAKPLASLRVLSKTIADSAGLLEDLVCNPEGKEVLLQWITSPSGTLPDIPTLETWVSRIAKLAEHCVIDHGISTEISRWFMLLETKTALHQAKANLLQNNESKILGHHDSSIDNSSARSIDDLAVLPKEFGLPVPYSLRRIENTLQALETDATISILQAIVKSYPCRLCNKDLIARAADFRIKSTDSTDNRHSEAISEGLLFDSVFGKDLGPWKIVLSITAMRSIQTLSSSPHFQLIQENLINLSTGKHSSIPAGKKHQKVKLKVPLSLLKCGKMISILWQVDVRRIGDNRILQIVKIWEVGRYATINKFIDRVTRLQQAYSDEESSCCSKHSNPLDEIQAPLQFNEHLGHDRQDSTANHGVDVRTVDQETIDMAHKFFTLTTPVYQTIIAKNLGAEFPLDVSADEWRVISHIQTSTLILGRSGTGKTTCLVFKLVGKYLSAKASNDERPIKQVLLTRSSLLSDKLRTYTKGLIKTQISKPDGEEPVVADFKTTEALENGVLNLTQESYPLICTFDQFLRLIENTVKALDRQNYSVGAKESEPLVDFAIFRSRYWPHLRQQLKKVLPAVLVFAEIMGVIKGSIASRGTLRPLSREEYLHTGSRLASEWVSESDRSVLYDLFENYEAIKTQNNDLDYVDCVSSVLRAIRNEPLLREILASAFDEIFVDEIQDHRSVDIELFLSIVKDSRGFHFAGDTAQTISQDSAFRFEDIKAMMFEHFNAAGLSTNQPELAKPVLFKLYKNYRSHHGIVAFASLITDLLWRAFPSSVDKLPPESGGLSGPKPVIFLGCNADHFLSTKVGDVELSENAADFGAEQVILVRDEASQVDLRNLIGETALVLTILQAKGMEFNDVILWNFFTGCADSSGLRSLHKILREDCGTFDARRHAGMCSELKHLYVAVTRARMQIFLVEMSESTVAPVVKLFTTDISTPLIEVVRPDHPNFAEKLSSLHPGASSDPLKWSRNGHELLQAGNFQEAEFCFRKAKDSTNEVFATAKIHEQKAHACRAVGDQEGYMQNLEAAITCFLSIQKLEDAADILKRMSRYERAADLYLKASRPEAAAPLFFSANLHVKASKCYHDIGEFASAADVLRKGGKFDRWILYLNRNRGQFMSQSFRRHASFVKIVLKQGKVDPHNRKAAISLLGSTEEQEACLKEYEMFDDLAEFYTLHGRYTALFHLLVQRGDLEKALDVALSRELWNDSQSIPESLVLKLIDYVWAGRLLSEDCQAIADEQTETLTPRISVRVKEWKARCSHLDHLRYAYDDSNDRITDHWSLLTTIKLADSRAEDRTYPVPFKHIQNAVDLTTKLLLRKDKNAYLALLLAAGIFEREDPQAPPILMSWSPFHTTKGYSTNSNLFEFTKTWFLDKLAEVLLKVNDTALTQFRAKWPQRCAVFLTTGFCSTLQITGSCPRLHRHWTEDEQHTRIKELLQINKLYCDVTPLYYCRVFKEAFQGKFLGTRRRWLEELTKNLIFISAFEQSTHVLVQAHTEVFKGREYSAILSSLQQLLYRRYNIERNENSNLCSLLETMQLAKGIGGNFFRSWSRNIANQPWERFNLLNIRVLLKLFNQLHEGSPPLDALAYRKCIQATFSKIEGLDQLNFKSLHALASEFEHLISQTILKMCMTAFVIPNSWIELYIPLCIVHSPVSELMDALEVRSYRECMDLAAATLSNIIVYLFDNGCLTQNFALGISAYPYHLLNQRLAELLVIMITNIASYKQPDTSFDVVQDVMVKLRMRHLQRANLVTLVKNLPFSYQKYGGKDKLVLITKNQSANPRIFAELLKDPTVKKLSIDELHHRCQTISDTKDNEVQLLNAEYSSEEAEHVRKLQHLWRKVHPRIIQQQKFKQSPKGQIVARFWDLAEKCNPSIRIRSLFFTSGVTHQVRLIELGKTLHRTRLSVHKRLDQIDVAAETSDESLDVALEKLGNADDTLKNAWNLLTDRLLTEASDSPVIGAVWTLLNRAEQHISEVEGRLQEVERTLSSMVLNQ